MAGLAKRVIEQNKLQDRVEIIQGSSFDIELPELADVLISETMGHLGLDEGIITTLTDARQRLLKKEARLIPQHIDIIAAPSKDDIVRRREVESWSQQHAELNFFPIVNEVLKRSYLRRVLDSELLAAPKHIAQIDLHKATSAPKKMAASFTINKPGPLHAFCAWFKADLGGGISLNSRNTSSWFPLHFPMSESPNLQVMQGLQFELSAQEKEEQTHWQWKIKQD